MQKKKIVIATRDSPLALWQANWVKKELERLHARLNIELLCLKTQGDKFLSKPLYEIGGKGLFVKELEEALLNEQADIAVHSAKDLPMELPKGLEISVICQRENPKDALVSNQFNAFKDLPPGSRIGTSSLRRQTQLLSLRPDLEIVSLRGNVDSRLVKLDKNEFDAIILAAAGLKRLKLSNRIKYLFSTKEMLPAAGQGVLAIESREKDLSTLKLITPLNHTSTHFCVRAERAMCKQLGGGCQVPVAAYAEKKGNKIYLQGLVGSLDGKRILRARQEGLYQNAEEVGLKLAGVLLRLGAKEILSI